jgi:SAM-dependent methyltransferase
MDVNTTPHYRKAPQSGGVPWAASVAGAHALAWQQAQIDHWVADVFGYHALQMGMPELQLLRHNRMPHQWLLSPHVRDEATDEAAVSSPSPTQVCAEFHALPFVSNCLDLVVMPHTLEVCDDPHQALREAERVLRPDGRLIISGFNPAGLWGAVARARRFSKGATAAEPGSDSALASVHDWVGYWRLRDWLHLLSFEVEGGRFGCYAPPVGNPAWMERMRWMESLGDRWWPVLGGVYAVMAVKRVRGMRLVGLARAAKGMKAPARTVVTQRHHGSMRSPDSGGGRP